MPEILTYDFMQRALLAALLVGLAAPMVGVFLVQRRLSLIGDGMGHVALAGVAVGVITNRAPVLTALVFAVLAAVG
ncbi:MAG TPA: metal ABC transporter permease, partial [Dermatophilaceae bacterium]